MKAQAHSNRSPMTSDQTDDFADEQLSALVDGEVSILEMAALMPSLEREVQRRAICQNYQMIGDLIRGSEPVSGVSPDQFLAGVRARLENEQVPVGGLQVTPVAFVRSSKPAANEAVFRWKLVAGFASLAAVMAVTWTVLGVAPGAQGVANGSQMAQLAQPASQAVAQVSTAQPVVVNTAQGPVIRDARLEELLAEHRQFGGMSALQSPAGFLRDATYQSAPQR